MNDLNPRLRRAGHRLKALFSERLKAPVTVRFLRAGLEALKLLLALIYFVFDELGLLVKWLAARFKPLDLYFNLIKRIAYALRTRGLGSPDPLVRTATPYLALPFVLFPISLLLPAKIYFLHLILKSPLYAIPALLLAKLFSAIFVKSTWDILRCVGRRSPRIRAVDDQWLRLEHWAKAQVHGLYDRLKVSEGFILARDLAREAADTVGPVAEGWLWRGRLVLRDFAMRARALIARWRSGRGGL